MSRNKDVSNIPVAKCTVRQLEQKHRKAFSAALGLIPKAKDRQPVISMDLIHIELVERIKAMEPGYKAFLGELRELLDATNLEEKRSAAVSLDLMTDEEARAAKFRSTKRWLEIFKQSREPISTIEDYLFDDDGGDMGLDDELQDVPYNLLLKFAKECSIELENRTKKHLVAQISGKVSERRIEAFLDQVDDEY